MEPHVPGHADSDLDQWLWSPGTGVYLSHVECCRVEYNGRRDDCYSSAGIFFAFQPAGRDLLAVHSGGDGETKDSHIFNRVPPLEL